MNRVRASSGALLLFGIFLVSLAGCQGGDRSISRSPLRVFAAASLIEAFQALERAYERAHPDIDVQLTFAGSQVLRLQIEQGAGADLFASANESHLRALVEAGLVSRRLTFAHNELALIVPRANPAGIYTFDDLPRADRIVAGADTVPVGIYTEQLLSRAAAQLGGAFVATIRSKIVSAESNVRLARAKVELGEADAAFVYRTDAACSDRVAVVAIPDGLNVRARYQIGSLTGSRHADQAAGFIDFVFTDPARHALRQQGFLLNAP